MVECEHPYYDKNTQMSFPCGQCPLCLKKRKREWVLRCTHELDSHDSAVFITLTYRDEELRYNPAKPLMPTLSKPDYQKFIKRLRKKYFDREIKYYLAGEYGSKTQRPHYHIIVYGLSMSDMLVYKNNLLSRCNKKNVLSSETLDDLWSYGHNVVGTVTRESIAYCAGYVQKKMYGHQGKECYEELGRIKPFNVSSNGLGKKWCMEHEEQIRRDMGVVSGPHKQAIPRYYRKLLGIVAEDYEEIIRENEIRYEHEYYLQTGMRARADVKDILAEIEMSKSMGVLRHIKRQKRLVDRTNDYGVRLLTLHYLDWYYSLMKAKSRYITQKMALWRSRL